MRSSFASLRAKAARVAGCAALLVSFASAQQPEARIVSPVNNSARLTLANSRLPMAQAANEAGRMPGDTRFQGISLYLSRSVAQESALETLIAAQQNPASPQYHQWLTPDQFAAQFGAADSDLAQVQNWLQQQGFSIDEVSRNRSIVKFSGTAAQVENAFGTEMHYFKVAGEKHFAPSTDLSVPSALAPVVLSVNNLTDMLRPKPRVKPVPVDLARKNFTSGQTGTHAIQPGDVSVIYDINAAYSAGYTGQGQSIAIVGQSAVVAQDITNFQNASSTPVRQPTMILVPNTGTSYYSSGDEEESDLDLEYSGAIAKGASIYFVYTGNASNSGGAFESLQYAVTNRIAPIISSSYGACEPALGATYYASYNMITQQGATQGQTIISAAGDDGSSDCYEETNAGLTTAQQAGLAVDWPASSQYVTALGGTEFPAADVATGSSTTYFSSNGTTDVVTSAKSYIPEMAWNDDAAAYGLGSGGGGVSIYTARPMWQTGVTGIASGSYRLVPDISLDSSDFNAPYLLCSSDTGTGISGSCDNGFRDVNNNYLTEAGGTSFAAPIFAGMLAIINQKTGALYQGVINPTLYTLAANSTTYSIAFHDIQSGTNECVAGTAYALEFTSTGAVAEYGPACPTAAATSYSTGVGYDEATGLGSIDLYNLLQAWPTTVALTGSSTTVSAATLTPAAGASDTITIKVASASSGVTTTPTGTANLSIDGTYIQAVTLSGGTATYNYSSTVSGAHVITAVYSGDTTFSTSTGAVTVTVVASTLKATTTTLSAATTPATTSTADAITITVSGSGTTPAPTGTVSVSVDGGTATSVALTAGTTTSTASYSFNSSVLGSHTITALYLGDTNYQTSTSTLTLSVAAPGTFTISAPALTISSGSTSAETVTVTPVSGFTGAVNVGLTTTANIVNACYVAASGTVSGVTTIPVTIYTNSSNCPSGALALVRSGTKTASDRTPAQPGQSPGRPLPLGLTMAGLLAVGFVGRRSRRLRGVIVVALLAVAGFAMSGCGSSNTSGAGISPAATKGAYAVTVTATDAATGTKTATATFTLTLQ